MKHEPFITVENITVRLWDKLYIQNLSWQIHTDEQWAVLGPNGAGKSSLVRALFHDVPVTKGRIVHHFLNHKNCSPGKEYGSIGYVSSELHRDMIEQENLQETFRNFSGKLDEFITVKSILFNDRSDHVDNLAYSKLDDVCHRIGILDILGKPIKSLSVGDMRKVLIGRALLKSPELLILDEPFDGLDVDSRESLSELINGLMKGPLRVILITHRFEEILPEITHVLFLKAGQVHSLGKKEVIFNKEVIGEVYGLHNNMIEASFPVDFLRDIKHSQKALTAVKDKGNDAESILIEMKDVVVKYGDNVALDNFSWSMKQGQNWAIIGPNGAGKSTVLGLITGENLQSYANEIYLFGKKKGSGESVWEIKNHIGFISSELQVQYPSRISGFDVVCSGFFDSIGLYRYCNAEQRKIATNWINAFNINMLSGQSFRKLSTGQKQLFLIARALVKSPPLLLLDEPCEGLDIANKSKVLEIVDLIGQYMNTHIILVTNHKEEIVPCITHKLDLYHGKIKFMGAITTTTTK